MEELTELALKLLEIEKRLLLEEKEEYSCAMVVVITAEGRYYEEVDEFNDKTEMDAAYGAIVERAKSKNATAIITINTARQQDVDGELDSYWWGKLAAENQPRCVSVTISGPNVKPLSISLPFSVENNQVVLGAQSEFEPAILNMLPNWP